MQGVDFDRILGRVIPQVIGFPDDAATANASTGEPVAEGFLVVVPSGSGPVTLQHWRASKLGTEDDQRLIQQPPLTQIGDQRRDGTVGGPRLPRQAGADPAVMIPTLVEQLHHPHSPLDQAAGQQAVVGETRFAGIRSVTLECPASLL